MATMGHLHGRRISVAIYGYNLDTKTLKLNGNLFTQLTGTEQHNPGGRRRQRGSNSNHQALLLEKTSQQTTSSEATGALLPWLASN